jgi:hypothetical protein
LRKLSECKVGPTVTGQAKQGEVMQVDWSIKFTDILIVVVTFLGPIMAVQIQKLLERNRETNISRNRLFKTLMATRALNLSPAHVEALNAVPIEFYGPTRQLKAINLKWKIYYEHLLTPTDADPNWESKRRNLLFSLLVEMSQFLKFDFDEVDIKKIYAPQGHAVIEADQEIIRRGFAELFKGQLTIPVEVRKPASSPANEKAHVNS